jgi:hypothetical protein
MTTSRLAAALLLLGAASVHAQSVLDSSAFRPLDLPAANTLRTGSGRPGRDYWQQRVDYRIRAALDPVANTLTGRETITYTNRSPDSLTYLWFHLEQNICAPGSITNQLNQPPLVFLNTAFDFSCKGEVGGLTLSDITVLGKPLEREIFGTTMRVTLPRGLAPGQAIVLELGWSFPVPAYGAGRMGHDGTLYELGQWYPRVAVYDDVRGWNHEPYIGAGEFYLEYGRFDVAITVPATYLVAATGRLQNPLETLTATQRARLATALHSDTAIAIVRADEAGDATKTRPRSGGTITWRFSADSVRDFAFAAAPNFRWDASGWRGIGVHTYYRPGATLWTEANRIVHAGLRHYSEQWLHYPYPHISSIEGPIEGMEYPMMTFDPSGPTRIDLQWVLAHELGHQWMPMVVGVNERLYPWMDEGFNTFIDLANAAQYFRGTGYGDSIETNPLRLARDHAVPGEQPLITRPIEVRDLFWTGYQKPALMLSLLRDEVLGPERFNDAFREYLKTWAFKHPTHADFFRLMRDRSGMELDWFWRGWVMTTARLDQAVDSVVTRDGATEVHLSNRGTMVMPLRLQISTRDSDGRLVLDTVSLPVEMWNLGSRFVYRAGAIGEVVAVVVDPENALPDQVRGNNRWAR